MDPDPSPKTPPTTSLDQLHQRGSVRARIALDSTYKPLAAVIAFGVFIQYFLAGILWLWPMPFIALAFIIGVAHFIRTQAARSQAMLSAQEHQATITALRSNGQNNRTFRPPTAAAFYRITFEYKTQNGHTHQGHEYITWSPPEDGKLPLEVGDTITIRRGKDGTAIIPLLHHIPTQEGLAPIPRTLPTTIERTDQGTSAPEHTLASQTRQSPMSWLRLRHGGLYFGTLLFTALFTAGPAFLAAIWLKTSIPFLPLLGLLFFMLASYLKRRWQQRQTLRFGTARPGQIVHVRSLGVEDQFHHEVTFDYEGFNGLRHRHNEYIKWSIFEQGPIPLHRGDIVPVKVDRRRPDVAVIPMLHGHKTTPRGADHRRALPTPPIDDKALDHTVQATLLDGLHTSRNPMTLGQLSIDANALRVTSNNPSIHSTTLDLSQPIQAHLTATMVDAQRAALHVTLRSQDPEQSPIAFSTHLPQHALSPHIPIQEKHLPFVSPQDFSPLWDTIAAHLRLHANNAWTMLNLTHSPTTPTPSKFTLPSKAQQTTPQTVSAAHTHKTTS